MMNYQYFRSPEQPKLKNYCTDFNDHFTSGLSLKWEHFNDLFSFFSINLGQWMLKSHLHRVLFYRAMRRHRRRQIVRLSV